MRQLKALPQTGFTLVELMVSISIMVILAVAGFPPLMDYIANAKLREGSNSLVAVTQLARAEALRRNSAVTVGVSGQTATLTVGTQVVRSVTLPSGFQASNFSATFSSTGLLTPFGTTVTATTSLANTSCSESIRCPAVRIEAGGTAGLCPTGVCS